MKVAQAVALTAESADDAPMADDSAAKTLTAFLGVSRSLSGRAWRQRPADAAVVRAHMQALGLDEVLARALAARGVPADQGADFLTPTLRALFPDPSSFMDMDAAAEAILDALQAKARIHVFADYDVDGAASAPARLRWPRRPHHTRRRHGCGPWPAKRPGSPRPRRPCP